MSSTNRLSQRAGLAAGQPISKLMSQALANPNLISLAAGFVDQQSLPIDPTQQALSAVLANPNAAQAALQYGTTAGYPKLREAILDDFLNSEGRTAEEMGLSIDQVVITAGSNQLLHLVGEILLDPGDIVICASPTYFVFLGTLNNIGVRALGVATDEHGMIPEALEQSLQKIKAAGEIHRVKAIYLLTYFDNPTGTTLPAGRRQQITQIAQRWSRNGIIQIIEDAAYRELRYYGDDIPSTRTFDEQGKHVIVAGTFSKSFSPGIRVGWGILPKHLVEPVCNLKGNIDFGSPNFNQHLMANVMRLGLFHPHIEQLRLNYRTKLDAMLSAADEHLSKISGVGWLKPSGGLYLWVKLPDEIAAGPTGQLFDAAIKEGVLYVPGEYCYPNEGEPKRNNCLRLSFGVQTCQGIQKGVEALSRAIKNVLP